MKVIMLGSGNTATVLAKTIAAAGHSVVQVWSRDLQKAAILAETIGAAAIASFTEIDTSADLCIIAVPDHAIATVAAQLKLNKQVLVHTAGSVSINVLKHSSPNYGVLYPLQSLRKETTELPVIPFLVDANSEEVNIFLYNFAKQLSGNAAYTNDTKRLQMHVTAVIVSNFTNHLYALAEDYCRVQQLNFTLLQPMIREVATRLQNKSAHDLQTGPASRGDEETIQKHLQILADQPRLTAIYQLFTESIQHTTSAHKPHSQS
jgi:predicted short-subunit dehydrogenase-like oxidoreductase (DUF2520 family)